MDESGAARGVRLARHVANSAGVKTEPGMWRGRAWNGRAGQAFVLVDSGVVDRATANGLPWTARGPQTG